MHRSLSDGGTMETAAAAAAVGHVVIVHSRMMVVRRELEIHQADGII